MTPTEKQMIDALFSKLAETEQQAKAAGQAPEASALGYIQQCVGQHPDVAYYMAQTLVVQDQALTGLAQRVEALEAQLAQAQAQAPQAGAFGAPREEKRGFLSSLFGGGASAPRTAQAPRAAQAGYQGQNPGYGHPQGMAQYGRPGGAFAQAPQGSFLGGAMQTAVGVAGGVLLGNAVASMFAGDAAAAPVEDMGAGAAGAMEDPSAMAGEMPMEDAGMFDGGFDEGFDDLSF